MKAPFVLRATDRIPTRWKNGGGVTREVAVFPIGASFDDFLWRISMAEVRVNGPFSNFPGIDRRLAVIEGTLSLKVGADSAIQLSPDSEPVALAGDVPTDATVVVGPVTDLNVMTRRGRVRSTLRRHLVREPQHIQTVAVTTVLLAHDEISITHGDIQHTLAAFDAILIEPATPLTLTPLSRGPSSPGPSIPGPTVPSPGGSSNLKSPPRAARAVCYVIELCDASPPR